VFRIVPPLGKAFSMWFRTTMLAGVSVMAGALCSAQSTSKPQNATAAILEAFDTHDVVALGEMHGNKQLYEWLRSLVTTSAFADRVDDIVMEFGNSLYQRSVDRYVGGQDVPLEQVEKAWRNMVGAVGPPSPVYASLYKAVRDSNINRNGKHQIRILCGDPYIDWDKVKDTEDIGPFLAHRDDWYTQVVKDEVLAKHHRALLIIGSGHLLRRNGPGYIEQHLREASAHTYLIIAGTNTIGSGEIEHRFDSWNAPAIISTTASWVGELPAQPITSGGGPGMVRAVTPRAQDGPVPALSPALKLQDAADALLYLGPADTLTQIYMGRAELEGTPYGKELIRRFNIMFGRTIDFIPDQPEVPQFSHPHMTGGSSGVPSAPPPPPKSIHDPLPPRPPSQ
jgi:uncharacterized iron-regulated protein